MLTLALSFTLCIAFASSAPVNETNYKNAIYGKYYQGDIVFEEGRGVAQIDNMYYRRWPYGIIPYTLDYSFSQSQRSSIENGMRQIEKQVNQCIRFVPNFGQYQTWISIEGRHQGCFSQVGMQQRLGPQVLSLQIPYCVTQGVAMHELLHAVGFHHEHQRPDRDNYLTIQWDNVDPNQRRNFDKFSSSGSPAVHTMGFPYDYQSIMQYSEDAFSKNGRPTMLPKQPGVTLPRNEVRTTITSTDAAEIKKLYGCR